MVSVPTYYLKGEDGILLKVYITGSVLSYVAVIFNITVFIILFRKNILSPATILMQGLALADGLTAFCSYGLEPLFLQQYSFDIFPYPSCMLYSHVSLLTMTFHTVSVMLTTCLGIQKVIAMLFPIWTKCHLTNMKAKVCCVVCFFFSITISLPRNFALKFKNEIEINSTSEICDIQVISSLITLEYSSVYYVVIQTVMLTCFCILMIMCTIYIVYKLVTGRFHRRQTARRRQERRSVIMVVIVMVVFLISEIPKVCLFLIFSVKYFGSLGKGVQPIMSVILIFSFERGMALILLGSTDGYRYMHNIFQFTMEGTKIFTLIGCMSNLIIYITMSKQLRMEVISLCKNQVNRTNAIEIEMN